jgi:molecular chaperone DnaJ
MSEKRDYYEVLGVERSTSSTDLRKAYKKLALKFHPDRNNGCEDATDQFKECTEAYAVLSDDGKRQRYDQFGHAGMNGGADFGADIFSHVQDMFSDVFGSDFFGGFAGQQQQRRAARGRDLRVEQTLSLEEAALGCKKELEISSPVKCDTCTGSGAKPGTSPTTCQTCAGHGQVSTGRGFIMFTQPCPACRGEGTQISDPCGDCSGSGWQERDRTVTVSFPAGIDAGHRLRVSGQGMAGPRGGPPGNLYVDVALQPHPRFEREGTDLIARHRVSFPDATLGSEFELEMLNGSLLSVTVEPGTQPNTVISMPGKGVPSVNGRGVGALHVVVQVGVPTKLSRRAKKLLRQLQGELDDD